MDYSIGEIIVILIGIIAIIPWLPSLFETEESPIIKENEPEERIFRIYKYTITVKKDKVEEEQE